MTYLKNDIKLLNWLVFLIPFSLVLGSFILNLNLILISILLILHFIFNEELRKYIKFKWVKTALAILIYLLISSFINDANVHSLVRSLGFIKFISLSLALLIVFENDYRNFLFFLKVLLLVTIFVIIDSLIQFFFGTNLFGNDYQNNRLSSIFGDEYVVGAFLAKTGFLVLMLPFLVIKNEKLKQSLIFLILISFMSIILLSGERMASILFITGILLFYFIKSFKNFKNFFYIIITTCVIILVFSSNSDVNKRFSEIAHEKYGLTKDLKIRNSVWGAHFLTAYEIFKDNPLFGVGPKNFRLEAAKDKYDNINSTRANQRWSTHPHNIVLEILAEQGIIGMILFLNLLFHILRGLSLSKEINLLVLISISIFLWPLGTSGSIFTTWNGSFMWINFAILLFIKEKFKTDKVNLF